MFRAALLSLLATVIIALFAFEIVPSQFAPAARYAYLLSLGAFFYTFIVGLVERFVPQEDERPETTALSEDAQTLVDAMNSAEIALRLASVEFAVVENADQAASVIQRSDPDFLYIDDMLEGALAARRSKNRARVLILLSDERLRQPDPVVAGALSHFGVGNELYASEGAAR